MKKIFSLLLLSAMLVLSAAGADAASLWSKYVAADKSYSFHYPSGWTVVPLSESIVGAENTKTDEELLMAMIPFNQTKSPQDLAKGFLAMLKEVSPNVSASNWRSQPESKNIQVIFDLTNKVDGKEYSGLGIVIKANQQATWFSYTAPKVGYSKVRGANILQGFLGSLASGSGSKAPTIDYNAKAVDNIDRNAQAFMFVLEFSMGAPFSKSQEDIILKELKTSWHSMSEAELQKYDQYPTLVQSILKMGQKDLDKLRVDLEKSIQEWLASTDQADPAVKIISSQLKTRSKIVIKGEPPLTEMSLTAYSEIIAYSRLLQVNPKAMPDQITQKSVDEIKLQVKKVWTTFSTDNRKDIATAPGLWLCQRVLLQNGTQAEQDKIRASLKKLEAVSSSTNTTDASTSTNTSTGSGIKSPMDLTLSHWNLMQIQQQTFNTYMWSRGFNYLPAVGRMW